MTDNKHDKQQMANFLHVISESEDGLTESEVAERAANLSKEDQLDALARYEEHDEG